MTLPDRLRLYARQFEDQHAPANMTMALRAAADEIEQLRNELVEARRMADVERGRA